MKNGNVGKCLVRKFPGREMTKSGKHPREMSGLDKESWEMGGKTCFLCGELHTDIATCEQCELVSFCQFHEKCHRLYINENGQDQFVGCFPT